MKPAVARHKNLNLNLGTAILISTVVISAIAITSGLMVITNASYAYLEKIFSVAFMALSAYIVVPVTSSTLGFEQEAISGETGEQGTSSTTRTMLMLGLVAWGVAAVIEVLSFGLVQLLPKSPIITSLPMSTPLAICGVAAAILTASYLMLGRRFSSVSIPKPKLKKPSTAAAKEKKPKPKFARIDSRPSLDAVAKEVGLDKVKDSIVYIVGWDSYNSSTWSCYRIACLIDEKISSESKISSSEITDIISKVLKEGHPNTVDWTPEMVDQLRGMISPMSVAASMA